MESTLTVTDLGGTVVSESSHPTIELAWRQVHRDLEMRWSKLKAEGLADEKWAEMFDYSMGIARQALPDFGTMHLGTEGATIFTYTVTPYEPLPMAA
jgi:hypothetical protein